MLSYLFQDKTLLFPNNTPPASFVLPLFLICICWCVGFSQEEEARSNEKIGNNFSLHKNSSMIKNDHEKGHHKLVDIILYRSTTTATKNVATGVTSRANTLSRSNKTSLAGRNVTNKFLTSGTENLLKEKPIKVEKVDEIRIKNNTCTDNFGFNSRGSAETDTTRKHNAENPKSCNNDLQKDDVHIKILDTDARLRRDPNPFKRWRPRRNRNRYWRPPRRSRRRRQRNRRRRWRQKPNMTTPVPTSTALVDTNTGNRRIIITQPDRGNPNRTQTGGSTSISRREGFAYWNVPPFVLKMKRKLQQKIRQMSNMLYNGLSETLYTITRRSRYIVNKYTSLKEEAKQLISDTNDMIEDIVELGNKIYDTVLTITRFERRLYMRVYEHGHVPPAGAVPNIKDFANRDYNKENRESFLMLRTMKQMRNKFFQLNHTYARHLTYYYDKLDRIDDLISSQRIRIVDLMDLALYVNNQMSNMSKLKVPRVLREIQNEKHRLITENYRSRHQLYVTERAHEDVTIFQKSCHLRLQELSQFNYSHLMSLPRPTSVPLTLKEKRKLQLLVNKAEGHSENLVRTAAEIDNLLPSLIKSGKELILELSMETQSDSYKVWKLEKMLKRWGKISPSMHRKSGKRKWMKMRRRRIRKMRERMPNFNRQASERNRREADTQDDEDKIYDEIIEMLTKLIKKLDVMWMELFEVSSGNANKCEQIGGSEGSGEGDTEVECEVQGSGKMAITESESEKPTSSLSSSAGKNDNDDSNDFEFTDVKTVMVSSHREHLQSIIRASLAESKDLHKMSRNHLQDVQDIKSSLDEVSGKKEKLETNVNASAEVVDHYNEIVTNATEMRRLLNETEHKINATQEKCLAAQKLADLVLADKDELERLLEEKKKEKEKKETEEKDADDESVRKKKMRRLRDKSNATNVDGTRKRGGKGKKDNEDVETDILKKELEEKEKTKMELKALIEKYLQLQKEDEERKKKEERKKEKEENSRKENVEDEKERKSKKRKRNKNKNHSNRDDLENDNDDSDENEKHSSSDSVKEKKKRKKEEKVDEEMKKPVYEVNENNGKKKNKVGKRRKEEDELESKKEKEGDGKKTKKKKKSKSKRKNENNVKKITKTETKKEDAEIDVDSVLEIKKNLEDVLKKLDKKLSISRKLSQRQRRKRRRRKKSKLISNKKSEKKSMDEVVLADKEIIDDKKRSKKLNEKEGMNENEEKKENEERKKKKRKMVKNEGVEEEEKNENEEVNENEEKNENEERKKKKRKKGKNGGVEEEEKNENEEVNENEEKNENEERKKKKRKKEKNEGVEEEEKNENEEVNENEEKNENEERKKKKRKKGKNEGVEEEEKNENEEVNENEEGNKNEGKNENEERRKKKTKKTKKTKNEVKDRKEEVEDEERNENEEGNDNEERKKKKRKKVKNEIDDPKEDVKEERNDEGNNKKRKRVKNVDAKYVEKEEEENENEEKRKKKRKKSKNKVEDLKESVGERKVNESMKKLKMDRSERKPSEEVMENLKDDWKNENTEKKSRKKDISEEKNEKEAKKKKRKEKEKNKPKKKKKDMKDKNEVNEDEEKDIKEQGKNDEVKEKKEKKDRNEENDEKDMKKNLNEKEKNRGKKKEKQMDKNEENENTVKKRKMKNEEDLKNEENNEKEDNKIKKKKKGMSSEEKKNVIDEEKEEDNDVEEGKSNRIRNKKRKERNERNESPKEKQEKTGKERRKKKDRKKEGIREEGEEYKKESRKQRKNKEGGEEEEEEEEEVEENENERKKKRKEESKKSVHTRRRKNMNETEDEDESKEEDTMKKKKKRQKKNEKVEVDFDVKKKERSKRKKKIEISTNTSVDMLEEEEEEEEEIRNSSRKRKSHRKRKKILSEKLRSPPIFIQNEEQSLAEEMKNKSKQIENDVYQSKNAVESIVKQLKEFSPDPCTSISNNLNQLRLNVSQIRQKIQLARTIVSAMKIPVSLDGKQRLEVMLDRKDESREMQTSVEICIQPKSSNSAILSLHANNSHSYSLALVDSKPLLTIWDANGDVLQKLEADTKLIQDNWYQLVIRRIGHNFSLSINPTASKSEGVTVRKLIPDFPPEQIPLSLASLGGYPENFPISDTDKLKGCIAYLNINGHSTHILSRLESGSYPPSCKTGCESVANTSMVFEGNGFALLESDEIFQKTFTSVHLTFKTFQKDALLMAIKKNSELFFLVALIDGNILVESKVKSLIVAKQSQGINFSDGQLHTITVNVIKDQLEIEINTSAEKVEFEENDSNSDEISFEEGISLGGLVSNFGNESKYRSFTGCLSNVSIDDKLLSLLNLKDGRHVYQGDCQENTWMSCARFTELSAPVTLTKFDHVRSISLMVSVQSQGVALFFERDSKFSIALQFNKTSLKISNYKDDESKIIPKKNASGFWHLLHIEDQQGNIHITLDGEESVDLAYTEDTSGWFSPSNAEDFSMVVTVGGLPKDHDSFKKSDTFIGSISTLFIQHFRPNLNREFASTNNLLVCAKPTVKVFTKTFNCTQSIHG